MKAPHQSGVVCLIYWMGINLGRQVGTGSTFPQTSPVRLLLYSHLMAPSEDPITVRIPISPVIVLEGY